MTAKTIRIGGATGFWGDADIGFHQFLAEGDIDYIVFDYLAEITLSIMARARSADTTKGYALDFVDRVMRPNLTTIAEQGIKVISNAGGVNPVSCADALRTAIAAAGVPLRVAVVVGDDVMALTSELQQAGVVEMFSGEAMPPAEKIVSANAYLGAFPIAAALADGADIVITGRCVDSAVTLGACVHAFGWQADQLDVLASGSLIGHLIECGPQVTGGNYTDWETVADNLHEVGYPIAEISPDGSAVITKPKGTGGVVTRGTVGEQLLYEIGDPAAYVLPDVVCDFTEVTLRTVGQDAVSVAGARGRGVPQHYKVSITWFDDWRAGTIMFFAGRRAADKARLYVDTALERARQKLARKGLPDYTALDVEIIGPESHWGEAARHSMTREVAFKVACRHVDKAACELLMRELTGVVLGGPPGFFSFAGTRPKPSPVVRLFSTLIAKERVAIRVLEENAACSSEVLPFALSTDLAEVTPVPIPSPARDTVSSITTVPLERLAYARSGDKGNKANIGIMAREARFLPWIARCLTVDYVADRFGHFMTDNAIDRFYLPGLPALNFVLHNVLGGGGVASLRSDPQGKCYAQLLLDTPVDIPTDLLD